MILPTESAPNPEKSLHQFETYSAILRLFQPNIGILIACKS